MEFLPSLPADLVAAADPSARGAAPLLRLPDGDGQAPAAALPFELCLALFTTPLPSGESWPATGKELPVVPFEPVAGEAAVSTPELLSGSMPRPRVVELPSSGVATELPSSTLPPIAAKPAAIAQPLLPGGEPAVSTTALASAAPADLEPITALATAEAERARLDGLEPELAPAPAKTAPAPSWLEAFTHERRLQRPTAVTPVTAPAATTVGSAVQNAPSLAAALPAQAVPGAPRHIELPKLLASVVAGADGTTSAPADWLPPATHGSATTSVATSMVAVPGAPVELRSPSGPEAFANRIQWFVDQQVGEAHIKLNPPELGAVEVKISLADDKTYVQLTTATAAARDELLQSLPRLRELFTASGLELGGASVHNGRDGHSAGHGYGAETGRPEWHRVEPFADGIDQPIAPTPRRSLGHIDVFA